MLDDGWTTVTAKDKKRVMRRSVVRRNPNVPSTSTPQGSKGVAAMQESSILSDGLRSSSEVLSKSIDECMGIIVKSDLFANLCSLLNSWMESTGTSVRVGKLVAYGIGNFSYTKATYHSASLWQLALALCIQKKVAAFKDFTVKIDYFDPCTTEEERRFLIERFDVHVMPINNQGKYIADSIDTIFLMPHCPAQLYENVVWSNYHNLQRILLIGNSLQNLAARPSPNELLCLRALLPNLTEMPLMGSPSDYKMAAPCGNFIGAWNDTYVSYFLVRGQAVVSRPYDHFNSKSVDMELM